MKHNIQPPNPDLVRRRRVEDKPAHRLDTMISRLGMQAAFSPLISKFETHPLEIPDSRPKESRRRKPAPPPDEIHDTVLIMKFRDKRAREEMDCHQRVAGVHVQD